jgi:hypothetical protein
MKRNSQGLRLLFISLTPPAPTFLLSSVYIYIYIYIYLVGCKERMYLKVMSFSKAKFKSINSVEF